MLDSTEDILREEGYGALTSRRIAERLGVKQRLVYYYFRTMEDLIAETFRRLATRELERLTRALATPLPLREIWDVCIHTHDARMIAEFVALANRSESLRKAVVSYIEDSRSMHVAALNKTKWAKKKEGNHLPTTAVALFATSAALAFRFIKQWEQAPMPEAGRSARQIRAAATEAAPRTKRRLARSRS